ncbi:CASP-like protein 1C1 [Camellia lanceoleosa]|uniref:CASP-like protein 1C1 n=1 Tax=Camellia lanceoleosa TaxID=1840588 RepID=A0ACC0GKM7_9ERIC|nr:CASP-like protein 1C1 [Camellia lanceoleosa]
MSMAKRIPAFVLRLIALGATITATVVMVTSHDSATVLNITFGAKYSYSPSLKYFVVINAIASGYGLIVLFLPTNCSLWRFVLVADLVIMALLDSSISAAAAIGYVGRKGNIHAGWLPICGQVPKFCDHASGAIISGIIATIIYFALLLHSLHNVINLLSVKA